MIFGSFLSLVKLDIFGERAKQLANRREAARERREASGHDKRYKLAK